jgi:hypothetical protein
MLLSRHPPHRLAQHPAAASKPDFGGPQKANFEAARGGGRSTCVIAAPAPLQVAEYELYWTVIALDRSRIA